MRRDGIVEAIRDRAAADPAGCYAAVGLDLQVVREGERWRALCPLHADRNPSLHVAAQGRRGRGVWYCFACQVGGDLLGLWQRLHPGADFPEAVAGLAQVLGIGGGAGGAPRPRPPPTPPPAPAKPARNPPSTERVNRAWQSCDVLERGAPETEYLAGRGLDWLWLRDQDLVRALPDGPLEWPHAWWRHGFDTKAGQHVDGLGRAVVVRVVGEDGELVALHARAIEGKRFMVSRDARPGLIEGWRSAFVLTGAWSPQGGRCWTCREVWVCEGLSDTLAASCAARERGDVAVVGMVGGMGPAGLEWLPAGLRVVLLGDPDEAGRKLEQRARTAMGRRGWQTTPG